ncbi:hypothetical protein CLOACE_18840 [Clostridium acetireducens DSM 10703]|uniref:Uncharacterized protein n=1 Tax=Clostridium acetireducens DSM 10703 TaxID=1121290 RepID=A0A1E8EX88_9CLOT|nr:hypothetical protein [Clostridium acetireducens]OFI05266.1 hypothetical protein CLOACE_18840 [Clostridium acetireducens DSM 10703]
MAIDLKKILKTNAKKKEFFVKWFVDGDKTKEDYNKNCKKNSEVEYNTAMEKWLLEEDVQEAIKIYMKKQRNIKMLEIYDSMYNKALSGDVKSAEWVEKFYKSDFFGDDSDEIDDFLTGINIPSLGGGKNGNK